MNKSHKGLLSFTIIFCLLAFSCGNAKKEEVRNSAFEMKGKLINASGEQLILEELTSKGTIILDSATLNAAGEFEFKHANPRLGFYRLRITESNFAMLVLDSSQKVTLTGDARNLGNSFTVAGSPDSRLFWEVNEKAKISFQKRDSMMRAYQAYANLNKSDPGKIKEYSGQAEEKYNAEARLLNEYLLEIINKNPASLVAIVALQQLSPDLTTDGYISQYKQIDQALTQKYPGSAQVKIFHESVMNILNSGMGAAAPDFQFDTPDGKKLGPSSFKGHVLLVDFWASWCAPCRAENPNMVKLYKKYHAKGLEILSVSLDNKKENWVDAIRKDNLDWNHVSDLGAWQSAAAKLYNVTSIPQTFLINKEGMIVAKGLRGEELDAKLSEVIGNQ
jgi:thiol-disulfide isomerase/thioredoxin